MLPVLLVALGACGSSGPTAMSVTKQLSTLYPTPNARDNSGGCPSKGCVELITTDAVSVYQWPDEATAQRFAGTSPDVDVVGPFALSYLGTEQKATSEDARSAYKAKVAELVER